MTEKKDPLIELGKKVVEAREISNKKYEEGAKSEYLLKISILGSNSRLRDRVLRSLSGDYSIGFYRVYPLGSAGISLLLRYRYYHKTSRKSILTS